jgi:hypothetical protein
LLSFDRRVRGDLSNQSEHRPTASAARVDAPSRSQPATAPAGAGVL